MLRHFSTPPKLKLATYRPGISRWCTGLICLNCADNVCVLLTDCSAYLLICLCPKCGYWKWYVPFAVNRALIPVFFIPTPLQGWFSLVIYRYAHVQNAFVSGGLTFGFVWFQVCWWSYVQIGAIPHVFVGIRHIRVCVLVYGWESRRPAGRASLYWWAFVCADFAAHLLRFYPGAFACLWPICSLWAPRHGAAYCCYSFAFRVLTNLSLLSPYFGGDGPSSLSQFRGAPLNFIGS